MNKEMHEGRREETEKLKKTETAQDKERQRERCEVSHFPFCFAVSREDNQPYILVNSRVCDSVCACVFGLW